MSDTNPNTPIKSEAFRVMVLVVTSLIVTKCSPSRNVTDCAALSVIYD